MPTIRPPPILAAAAALLLAGLAHGAAAPVVDQQAIIAQAEAVLRINDAAWVERELVQFSATAGIDAGPLRGILAGGLYAAKSLRGIDLSRPALMAWRPGASPLVAIIPLLDGGRQQFMNDFGAVLGMGAPMTQIGVRDGTTVYSQNTDHGLYEYRLLVQDDTAYVARTVDECRALAAKPLRAASTEPPLAFEAVGGFLSIDAAAKQLASLPSGAASASSLAILGYALDELPQVVEQVQSLGWSLRKGEEAGGWHLACRIVAKADTALAQWMANQHNQASRLLPAIIDDHTILTIHGGVSWQNQLERVGVDLGRALGKKLGVERWTPAIEQAWLQEWALLDQQGPFALGVDVIPAEGDRPTGTLSRFVCEQPHAAELAALDATVINAIAEPGAAPAAAEEIQVGGRGAQRRTRDDGAGHVATTVRVATDSHVIEVGSDRGDVVVAATELLDRLQNAGKPQGTPGILVLRCELTRLLQAFAPKDRDGLPPPPLAEVGFELACKAATQSDVSIETDLPMVRIAGVLRDSMVLQSLSADTPQRQAGPTPAPAPAPAPRPPPRRR